MDMAFLNAANRSDTFPPQDPWLAGADLNYYYLGQLAMAVLVKLTAVAPDQGYNLAVAALFALTAAARVHDRRDALGRGARAARRRPGRARRGRARARRRQPRGRAAADRRRRAAARVRLVRRLARDRRTRSTSSRGSRSCSATSTRTCSRCRSRCSRSRSRCRSCSPGRGWRRAGARCSRAAAAALAVGFLYAVNSWSYPVMAGLLALARASRGCATRAASPRAPRPCAGCCSCWPGARCSCCRSTSRSIRPRAGSGWCRRDAASPAGCATSCCCSARSPGSSRGPTPGG